VPARMRLPNSETIEPYDLLRSGTKRRRHQAYALPLCSGAFLGEDFQSMLSGSMREPLSPSEKWLIRNVENENHFQRAAF
jgi:hypothetical protein